MADAIPDTTASTIKLSGKRQIKKNTKTLVLDAVVMANMSIICVATICCDLKFFDISSGKCSLRLHIRNFPSPLSTFYYHPPPPPTTTTIIDDADAKDEDSRLVIGDFEGSIRVIDFLKNFKSHFRVGSIIRQFSYHELMKVRWIDWLGLIFINSFCNFGHLDITFESEWVSEWEWERMLISYGKCRWIFVINFHASMYDVFRCVVVSIWVFDYIEYLDLSFW